MLTNPEGGVSYSFWMGRVCDLLRTPTQNLPLPCCVRLSMRCVTHLSLMGTSSGIDSDGTGQITDGC